MVRPIDETFLITVFPAGKIKIWGSLTRFVPGEVVDSLDVIVTKFFYFFVGDTVFLVVFFFINL